MQRPSLVLITFFLAWLIGIAWPIGLSGQRLFLSLFLLLCGLFLAWNDAILTTLFGFLLTFFLAGWYFHWYLHLITPKIDYRETQTFRLTVLDAPTKNENFARYQAWTADNWNILLTLPRAQPVTAGTLLAVSGKLQPVAQAEDKNAQLRSAKNKTFAKLFNPVIVTSQPANLKWWQHRIIDSRTVFNRTITRLFTEPQAALFAGIVAGLRSDLPPDVTTNFQILGLSHIIAVSGFNITIAMNLLTKLVQRYGKIASFLVSIFAVSFVIVFTGASASVVRAGLMAALFTFARLIGRKAFMIRLLILTAVGMTVWNPLLLRYDLGFQLSFAALLGLILFATPLTDQLTKLHLPAWLAETISTTIAATITTLPITIANFGRLSLYSLPANILVGPLIPLLTITGIPLILLVSLLPLLAWLAYPFDLVLRYTLAVTNSLAQFPYAGLNLPFVPAIFWLIYGCCLITWYILLQPKAEV